MQTIARKWIQVDPVISWDFLNKDGFAYIQQKANDYSEHNFVFVFKQKTLWWEKDGHVLHWKNNCSTETILRVLMKNLLHFLVLEIRLAGNHPTTGSHHILKMCRYMYNSCFANLQTICCLYQQLGWVFLSLTVLSWFHHIQSARDTLEKDIACCSTLLFKRRMTTQLTSMAGI